jgi:hypothetical protein
MKSAISRVWRIFSLRHTEPERVIIELDVFSPSGERAATLML